MKYLLAISVAILLATCVVFAKPANSNSTITSMFGTKPASISFWSASVKS